MSADQRPEAPSLALPPQLRLLALLTAFEGLAMLAYAAADLVVALVDDTQEWGAVWFLVLGLGGWGLGLLWVARGLRRRQRWAFTPVLFTQLIFSLVAISFFGSATTLSKIIWALVIGFAVVVLRLLFSRPVRDALITPKVS